MKYAVLNEDHEKYHVSQGVLLKVMPPRKVENGSPYIRGRCVDSQFPEGWLDIVVLPEDVTEITKEVFDIMLGSS